MQNISKSNLWANQYHRPPSTALPNGWFNWVVPFWKTPDIHVLNHGSLDGFFFLRFIKVLRNICFAGCLITWPILFPIHITGGRGQLELERLSIGNVASSNKLYANAVVAWLFFGILPLPFLFSPPCSLFPPLFCARPRESSSN